MPNRVDGNVNGTRPTAPVQAEARQANRAEQAERTDPPNAAAQQADRVDISDQARLQAEQNRPRAGAEDTRGAAADAPSARAPEAGGQGAVNNVTAERAAQLREEQTADTQQTQAEPAEQQGNLVDVVG